jgi:hypothetical protein
MSVADLPQTLPIAETERSSWSLGWIVGPRIDLPWFIGGALAGYAMFFTHVFIESGQLRAWGLDWNMLTVWLVWWVFLDVPHFFGTYARTYLDREEFHKRRGLLLGSLAFPLLGPLLLLTSLGLFGLGVARYGLPFELMFMVVGPWAYWHVVRQHYGLLALYKRKNNDVASIDHWIDQALLYVGLIAPFFAMVARHPIAALELGLPTQPTPGSWHAWIVDGVLYGAIASVALTSLAFAVRQAYCWWAGRTLNVPKILFLLAVVPLHCFVCFHPAVLTASLMSFSAFVTIYHDLQYHAIVWHYQRNRIHRPGVDRSRYGLAALISSHFVVFMGCAVAMGIGAWALSCLVKVETSCMHWVPNIVESNAWPLFGDFTLQHLFFSIAVGCIMHHYFVDQFIWRPSKDSELRQDLRLNA